MPNLFQGDRIGRIFAYWVIVYFEHLCEKHRISQNIWATFFNGKSYILGSTKNWLLYISGDFSKRHLVTLISRKYLDWVLMAVQAPCS
jgi:hypothetical protein